MRLPRVPVFHSRPQLAIRWITDDLAISSAPSSTAWSELPARGIDAAVDLRTAADGDCPALVHEDIGYLAFPIDDGRAPDLDALLEVSAWITTEIHAGRRVLINCREGRGRSALVACATLVRLGYSLDSAYQMVGRSQPRIALSDSQVKALELLFKVTRSG